jgi:phage-related protein
LSGKDVGDLWFEEEPYKVYSAKVTGQPSIKVIPFDGTSEREYRGEGSIQFTAYWPYAHTPDFVETKTNMNTSGYNPTNNGKLWSKYSAF